MASMLNRVRSPSSPRKAALLSTFLSIVVELKAHQVKTLPCNWLALR